MRGIATFVFALFAVTASAQEFFIGDVGYEPGPPLFNIGSAVVATDGQLFYVFALLGMNRVRPDGTIVDPEPFGVYDMWEPISAAYGDGRLFVTHRGTTGPDNGWATSMTTDGRVLWSAQVAPEDASVVYDGRNFIAVYSDAYDFYDQEIRALVFSDESSAARPIIVAKRGADADFAGRPEVVRTDEGLLAVWREGEEIRGALFDEDGALSVRPQTIGTGFQRGLGSSLSGTFTVASSGSGALVVWANRSPGAGPGPLIAQHVDAEGTPVGDPFEIFSLMADSYVSQPEVEWDGSRYRLAWRTSDTYGLSIQIESAAIAPGVRGIESQELVVSGRTPLHPAIAVGADRLLIAWTDYGRGGVRGKIVEPNTSLAEAGESILRTDVFWALRPSAVWTGTHYLVAWSRVRGTGPADLVFRRFDRSGTPLDAEPRVAGAAADPGTVRLASNGSETAIVWARRQSVFVVRVAADGSLIDPEPRVVATEPETHLPTADVATDGRRFLIVWTGTTAVKARRLSARGGFVDANPLVIDDRLAEGARVVFDGSRFVVAHQNNDGVFASAVSTTGDVDGSVRVMGKSGDLAMATSGSTTLIVSGNYRALIGPTLRDARVMTGPPMGPIDAVWTGSWFVLVNDWAIYWVTPSGHFAEAPVKTFQVSGSHQIALASAGDGTVLLVYSKPSRTFRAALHGRVLAPRSRAAGR